MPPVQARCLSSHKAIKESTRRAGKEAGKWCVVGKKAKMSSEVPQLFVSSMPQWRWLQYPHPYNEVASLAPYALPREKVELKPRSRYPHESLRRLPLGWAHAPQFHPAVEVWRKPKGIIIKAFPLNIRAELHFPSRRLTYISYFFFITSYLDKASSLKRSVCPRSSWLSSKLVYASCNPWFVHPKLASHLVGISGGLAPPYIHHEPPLAWWAGH